MNPGGVRIEAPAKVNLSLRVLAREGSGYHQLETIYQALDLGDRVVVRLGKGRGVSLEVAGPDAWVRGTGPAEENLAVRAAEAFRARSGVTEGIEVRLEKRVPPRSGLGGGSSDAAAVLRALNRLFSEPLSGDVLLELSGALGSDVPFFLSPSPLVLAWGRGERLLPLPPLPPRPVLLLLPEEGVATREAFAWLASGGGSKEGPRPVVHAPERTGSWEGVRREAVNDFHGPVFRARPDLERLHRALLDTSPLLALLSGSGAALFAVYTDQGAAEAALRRVRAGAGEVRPLLTRTLEAMPAPHDEP